MAAPAATTTSTGANANKFGTFVKETLIDLAAAPLTKDDYVWRDGAMYAADNTASRLVFPLIGEAAFPRLSGVGSASPDSKFRATHLGKAVFEVKMTTPTLEYAEDPDALDEETRRAFIEQYNTRASRLSAVLRMYIGHLFEIVATTPVTQLPNKHKKLPALYNAALADAYVKVAGENAATHGVMSIMTSLTDAERASMDALVTTMPALKAAYETHTLDEAVRARVDATHARKFEERFSFVEDPLDATLYNQASYRSAANAKPHGANVKRDVFKPTSAGLKAEGDDRIIEGTTAAALDGLSDANWPTIVERMHASGLYLFDGPLNFVDAMTGEAFAGAPVLREPKTGAAELARLDVRLAELLLGEEERALLNAQRGALFKLGHPWRADVTPAALAALDADVTEAKGVVRERLRAKRASLYSIEHSPLEGLVAIVGVNVFPKLTFGPKDVPYISLALYGKDVSVYVTCPRRKFASDAAGSSHMSGVVVPATFKRARPEVPATHAAAPADAGDETEEAKRARTAAAPTETTA